MRGETLRNAALVVGSIVLTLLLAEGLIRLAINPGDFLHATLVEDPVLGYRIKPHTTGHDALGFRNTSTPQSADIVALGDSVTYGVSAGREGSWPRQLERLLQRSVYNMALGGYGPVEYLHLARTDARRLKPRLLLVGFYFGNDLLDAWRAVYERSEWQSWRAPQGSTSEGSPVDRLAAAVPPPRRFSAIRDWLARNSLLYSVARATVLVPLSSWEKARIAKAASPDIQMNWSDPADPSVRTIFTPRLRLSALDARHAGVQEGLRLTKQAFALLRREATLQAIELRVVLLPTKERVYCTYLQASASVLPEALEALCRAEADVKRDLIYFLKSSDIAYVDVTPALERHATRHVQLYPTDSDGHPQAAGYAVIAEAVRDSIRDTLPGS